MTKLSEEAKKLKKEYFRKWRANNKDKVKEYNKRYWERKAAEAKENK